MIGCHPAQLVKTCTDGTDCRVVNQPEDHLGSWLSHKFKYKAASRFEVVTSVSTGYICRIAGPYRAGSYVDITIFRIGGLKKLLLNCGEKTEADLGYRGEPDVIELPHEGRPEQFFEKAAVRSRHENVNAKIKKWQCMNVPFRHDINLHGVFFRAVCTVIQLQMNRGEIIIHQVGYDG